MKSQILSRDKSLPAQTGFTLIEILVVVGMTVMIMSFGLFFDLDSFRQHSFQADRDTLISLLQHARSRAVSNICYGATCIDGKPHGVRIENEQYIVFQGSSYALRDQAFDTILEANEGIGHSGLEEVVFSQLTGEATSGDIILSDSMTTRTSTISISTEGQIIWTH